MVILCFDLRIATKPPTFLFFKVFSTFSLKSKNFYFNLLIGLCNLFIDRGGLAHNDGHGQANDESDSMTAGIGYFSGAETVAISPQKSINRCPSALSLSNSAEDLALQGGDGQRGWRSRPKSLFLAYHPFRTAAQRFTIVLSAQKNDNDPYATTTSLPIRTHAPC